MAPAWQTFVDYRLRVATLSAKALDCLRRMLAGEEVTQETSGLSKREWREFREVLGWGGRSTFNERRATKGDA